MCCKGKKITHIAAHPSHAVTQPRTLTCVSMPCHPNHSHRHPYIPNLFSSTTVLLSFAQPHLPRTHFRPYHAHTTPTSFVNIRVPQPCHHAPEGLSHPPPRSHCCARAIPMTLPTVIHLDRIITMTPSSPPNFIVVPTHPHNHCSCVVTRELVNALLSFVLTMLSSRYPLQLPDLTVILVAPVPP